MGEPSISQQQWRGLDCVQLGAASSGAEAFIARRGATLLALRLPHPSGPVDIVDGYADADELAVGEGARCAILASFSNRLAAGRYRFDDVD